MANHSKSLLEKLLCGIHVSLLAQSGIVNLFVKWRILMGYKEESSGRTMRSGEVSVVMQSA
jgi:hypothetical protein